MPDGYTIMGEGWHPMIPWQFYRATDGDDVFGAHEVPPRNWGYPAGYAGPDVLVDPEYGILNPQVMRQPSAGDMPFNPRGAWDVTVDDLKDIDRREISYHGVGYEILGGIDAGELALAITSGLAGGGRRPANPQVAARASADLEARRIADDAAGRHRTVTIVAVLGGVLLLAVGGVLLWVTRR